MTKAFEHLGPQHPAILTDFQVFNLTQVTTMKKNIYSNLCR